MPASRKLQYALSFLLGATAATATLFILSAHYSDYRRRAEIQREIQLLQPLQTQLAQELATGGIRSNLPSIQRQHPAVRAVSRDGWILLATPRFGQSVLLIPQQQNGQTVWQPHYNDVDQVINNKALCF
ncbi:MULTISPECIES: hypothetical protein [Eikenella]|uniref:Two-component sensor histidine kinase n=1 Tax=Eikenella longinqua TaxID=1795827 RepID=A0A1A9S2T0_9NEIS|nr:MULTISPECIES: hypothetical protein [Eikenella]OAM31192.1 hypothetical protein A7P95_01475 [Eikenella longinqua]